MANVAKMWPIKEKENKHIETKSYPLQQAVVMVLLLTSNPLIIGSKSPRRKASWKMRNMIIFTAKKG